MNIHAKVILGAQATRYFDETGKFPTKKKMDDLGGIIFDKYFGSREEYNAYVEALDDSDGWDGWVVVEQKHTQPERENFEDIIKDIFKEGPLVSLYFVTGINMLKEEIDKLSDKEIKEMFSGLLHPQRVRSNITHIHNKINRIKDVQKITEIPNDNL